MLPLFLLIAAVLFAWIRIYRDKENLTWVETFLSSILFFSVGFMSLVAFIAHLFFGPTTAQNIGWPAHNPFQLEIAMANLAFAALGLLSIRFRGHFWTAAALGYSIFTLGAMLVHLAEFLHGNTMPLNIGPFIWFQDLLVPLLLLSLLAVYLRQKA